MLRPSGALLLSVLIMSVVPLAAIVFHIPDSGEARSVWGTDSPLMIEGDSGDDLSFDLFSHSLKTSAWPGFVSIGDFNNDSLEDVAVASPSTARVEFYFQRMAGDFGTTPGKIVILSSPPTGMDVGDLDRDGADDLVVACAAENKVHILLQKNSFDPSNVKDAALSPYGVVVADFDGDYKDDFAVVSHRKGVTGYNCSFAVHLSDQSFIKGSNHYINFTGSYEARHISSSDFNGDGKPDIAIADPRFGKITVFRNDITGPGVDGTWPLVQTISRSGPSQLFFRQVDMSGSEELVVLDRGGSAVAIYKYSTTSSVFELWKLKSDLQSPSTISMTDENGDGVPDLIVASDSKSKVDIFVTPLGSVPYGSSPEVSFPCHSTPLVANTGLINGDGLEDLVLSANSTGTNGSITVYYGQTSGFMSNANDNSFLDSGTPSALIAGDFDDDSASEIGALLLGSNAVKFVNNDSIVKGTKLTGTLPSDVLSTRLRSGNSLDAVVSNSGSDNVTLYWGGPNFFSSSSSSLSLTTNFTAPRGLSVGDVSGDGRLDIVVGCLGGFQVFYNLGSGSYFNKDASLSLPLANGNFTFIATGNLNIGDEEANSWPSLLDIAVVNHTKNTVELYMQSAKTSRFSQTDNKTLFPSSTAQITWMGIGKVNNDALPDIVVALSDGSVVVYLQNIGFNKGFDEGEKFTYQTPYGVSDADLGDVDDDGLDEVALVGSTLGVVTVVEMMQTSFVTLGNFSYGAGQGFVGVADVNLDLRTDILISSPLSGSISIAYQNNIPPLTVAECVSVPPLIEGTEVVFDGRNSTDSFSDKSSLAYNWSFGDGTMGEGATIPHVYMRNDTYQVSLRVTDRGNLTNYSNLTVTINDASPAASFTYAPTNPIEGNQVTFTDTSTSYPDQIVNWTWEFGYGEKAYTKDSTYVYEGDGTYSVSLTVVDDDGSYDELTKDIFVADAAPRADFTVSNLSPLENTTVYFNDTSYSDPDTIVSYSWMFGDGSVEEGSDASHVSHVYLQNGSYNVTLTVTDSDGSTSKHWDTVQVQDSSPSVSFEFSPYSPYEGVTVQFTDESSAYDGIATWYWDFGDGSTSALQNPSHSYGDNGSYDVTLVVTDGDGSASQRTTPIVVQDTSPNILSLMASSGATSFDEDESIVFTVNAVPSWESIETYEWDFAYSDSFVPFSNTIINHTSHSYPQNGAYLVAVRVWDSDSYSTADMLTIDIENVRPTANFVNSTSGTGEVIFDASTSFDTSSDNSSLQFSWNFGDGTDWTQPSLNRVIRHTFVNKSREYGVVLNVIDNDGAIGTKTIPVIVDETKPLVRVMNADQRAVVGSPITISANVTDPFGVYNVSLHYRIGEEVRIVTMSQTTVNIYEAQIPSQNSTVTIFFWVQAFDTSGNSFMTGEYELVVQEAIPPEYLYGGIGAFAVLAAGLFLGVRRRYATVDEAFIIYEDGRLIAHRTRHLKPGMDDEVLSSMLVAIQNFVKDSFKDETTTALKRLDFGEKKILVERGDKVYLAAVLHGKHAGKIPQKLLQVIEEIQIDFGAVFAQWDGDLESVRGVKDKTRPLFKQTLSITRIIRVRRSPQEIGPMTIECPICDRKISPDSKKCPSCGVDLSDASVDDLEKVAYDILKEGAGLSTPSEQESSSLQKDRD